jgi:hypothetical protein
VNTGEGLWWELGTQAVATRARNATQAVARSAAPFAGTAALASTSATLRPVVRGFALDAAGKTAYVATDADNATVELLVLAGPAVPTNSVVAGSPLCAYKDQSAAPAPSANADTASAAAAAAGGWRWLRFVCPGLPAGTAANFTFSAQDAGGNGCDLTV